MSLACGPIGWQDTDIACKHGSQLIACNVANYFGGGASVRKDD